MAKKPVQQYRKIPALTVNQWLEGWERILIDDADFRSQPPSKFYLFSMPILDLKRLTGITRREREGAKDPAEETAVQRRHMPKRSLEILRFLKYGFPLSKQKRSKILEELDVLQMPGWLPTPILVNINEKASSFGKNPKKNFIVIEQKDDRSVDFHLPTALEDPNWVPRRRPFDIIDGQHRLWALDDEMQEEFKEGKPGDIGNFEIPVVAFLGLAPTWQAYLFYTINQLPKRINTSLVFDLYPLLRTQEWLLRFEGPGIYRETRTQELVTILWSHPSSVWMGRILRFGGRQTGFVTQASFVRALMSSFVKSYDPSGKASIGGLFGSRRGEHQPVLNWDRDQQAAFLIICWEKLFDAVRDTNASWAKVLGSDDAEEIAGIEDLLAELKLDAGPSEEDEEIKPRQDVIEVTAFSGPNTLIATDQGVRGYFALVNNLVWIAHESGKLDLEKWKIPASATYGHEAVLEAIKRFPKDAKKTDSFLSNLARAASEFDWRIPGVISEEDPQFSVQASYRGSGGYRLLRQNLTRVISRSGASGLKTLIKDWKQELELVERETKDE